MGTLIPYGDDLKPISHLINPVNYLNFVIIHVGCFFMNFNVFIVLIFESI